MRFPERLETDRLFLVRYGSQHASGLLELVRENRQELIRDFAQLANLQNLEQAEAFTQTKAEEWQLGKDFCFGILRKDTSQQIGQLRVKNISWEVPSAELSYFIDGSSQRQGFATESIRTVLTFAFQQLQFQRLFVRILPSNQRSLALVKKLGFQEEGLHRKAFRCGFGELHDVHFLSTVRQDRGWLGRPETTESSPENRTTSTELLTHTSLRLAPQF